MNIVIAAVGGQGAVLTSKILGTLAQNIGKDVKVSEVHGMSQRGGSVIAYVRFGDNVYSPVVEKGTADILLAFEMLEGARYIEYLKENGTLIVNTQRINPMPVITGEMMYPDDLDDKFKNLSINYIPVDALSIAKSAGTIKAVNVALIGVLAKNSSIEKDEWIKAIKDTVPEKFLELNLNAFEMGYRLK
ncbi:pyruvate ferredoxin/flavodoxin oxidoreductase [Methanococcus vannielii SB]|jgi:indolepyruvate ferredoxin oxidoreductase beta subunit|uniref:Pyruvate ferredoxin/flavodoxin oxidoreductase n=1 Tax=Methanococcus vannielii (strain ATCC 35089 / DSM 1224 / JCM 13029 / OCM 148 / SB) TaxID=406327 RepID=A6USK9_METVS|nr:indolepyruvate oxidoreductase subunit beta [Methanococcus vannielii]ABR55481.1 pyruvate ferredoxin/flavodoxin oxidoreductase [Methanococcus vannielii SB]